MNPDGTSDRDAPAPHGYAAPRVVLASASPRRQELLRSIGLRFAVEPSDADETEHPGESPRDYVGRVAQAKAGAVADRLGRAAGLVVLAADTTVDLDGQIMAKPVDDADARRMLGLLSGRTHQVHTAVCAWCSTGLHAVTVTTDVTFVALTAATIEWYLSMGEHLDKAGAYGMQTAGGALVRHIAGSPSNVIGLPVVETVALLAACGVALDSS
ncbi:MAG TPA: Maf family protein [Ilumatobacter sp.]